MTGPLRQALGDYLALRRALGYRLERPEKLLSQFLNHLESTGQDVVTVRSAVEWARLPKGGAPNWWGYRLSVVRGFATYLHALDPAHEVPAAELLPQRPQRATPYLYSTADVAVLMAAAGSLSTPLRRATVATLIGLLAVTGMRVGEAIALDRADIVVPPESWRASLCGFPVGGRGVLVVDRAHHARRAVPPVLWGCLRR